MIDTKMQQTIDNLLETVFVKHQQILALREMLKRLEWVTPDDEWYYCEICDNTKPDGHEDDCELQALLKEEE